MNQHYGKPLCVKVAQGKLTIEVGVNVLANACAYADWANPWDDERQEYIRTFAITDSEQFARDVAHAMTHEAEDGSIPLSDFLDQMLEVALDDGSEGAEFDQAIKHGEFSRLETWAMKGKP